MMIVLGPEKAHQQCGMHGHGLFLIISRGCIIVSQNLSAMLVGGATIGIYYNINKSLSFSVLLLK